MSVVLNITDRSNLRIINVVNYANILHGRFMYLILLLSMSLYVINVVVLKIAAIYWLF